MASNRLPEAKYFHHIPTEYLREKIRTYSRQQREKLRANDLDSLRFGLGEIQGKIKELDNLTVKDVTGLAARIKRRKHATVEDMYRLCHAFLQSIENIRAFATIPGAIQILVKELTNGSDSERQIAASESLCNLSLGESPVCEKIASLAGSYLVTYLDANEERLKRTSLWTLANILSTGGKSAQTLMQMELVRKLWQLYIPADLPADASNDYREDAAICLQIVSEPTKKLLTTQDLEHIKKNLATKNPTSAGGEYHLQIIFNCDIVNPNNLLSEKNVIYLINYSLGNITQITGHLEEVSFRLRLIFAVRILSNLIATQPMALNLVLSQAATVWQTNLVKILNKLFGFKNEVLSNETLWFLKILTSQENSALTLSLGSFLDKLRIPLTYAMLSQKFAK